MPIYNSDNLEMKLGIGCEPIDKKPDDVIACQCSSRCVGKYVSNISSFLLAFGSRPLPECLFKQRLVFFALNSFCCVFIVQIEPRHYFKDGFFFFPDFVFNHFQPMLEELIRLFLFTFGPCTSSRRQQPTCEWDRTSTNLKCCPDNFRDRTLARWCDVY